MTLLLKAFAAVKASSTLHIISLLPMDKGLVPFRKVGAHYRIPVDALKAWEKTEAVRREAALDRLPHL